MEGVTPRDSRRWLILLVLCLSTMPLVVDNLALTVAVPDMARDLHAGAARIQWVLDSYPLVFAGLLLTTGGLGDRLGRRRIMIIGLLLFGAASLAGAFAANPAQLIAARVGMGIGAAVIMPTSLAILNTVFDTGERRRAMAIWGGVSVLGLIGGPMLAGALISQFGWGAVFSINAPIVAVAIIAALVLIPESRGARRGSDPVGAVLSVLAMTAIVATIIEWQRRGFGGITGVLLLSAALGSAGFIAWERHTAAPMLPLELFRGRSFSGAGLALILVPFGTAGVLLTLTQSLQFVRGYSTTQAGMVFVPMVLASLLGNGIGAGLGVKVGNTSLTVAGMLLLAGGSALLATVAEHGIGALILALCVLGAGGGLALPAAVATLTGAISAEHAGVGSALNDTIQQAGAALGVAVLGALPTDRFTVPGRTGDAGPVATAPMAFGHAMHTTLLTGAAVMTVGAVLVHRLLREREAPGWNDFEDALRRTGVAEGGSRATGRPYIGQV